MTNRIIKKSHFAKSKIFITFLCIFGLAFSYGCRKSGGGGVVTTDPSTFSIGAKTDNVVSSIVQSAKVFGEIKIGFDASHEYTTEFTVEDSDTTETTKLTETDFTLSGNVLSLNDSGLGKVRAIDSSAQPTSKTITINFTLKANDPSLINSTQTLPIEVKLTHARKPDEAGTKTIIEEIFKAIGNNSVANCYDFDFSKITYNDKIEIKNTSSRADDTSQSQPLSPSTFVKEMSGSYGFDKPAVKELGYISSAKFEDISNITINVNTAIFYVNLTFNPEYEIENNRIEIDVDAKGEVANSVGKWETTTQS